MNKPKLISTLDWILFGGCLVLLAIGAVTIFSLTSQYKITVFYSQLIFDTVGLLTAVVLTFVDYRSFKSVDWLFYAGGLIFLVLVLLFSSSVFGARRWIDFGIFQFQPAELMKFFIIISLAKLFSQVKEVNWKVLLKSLFLVGLPVALILSQPDLGSAAVFLIITAVLLLAAKVPKIYLAAALVVLTLAAPILYSNLADYQKQRVKTFLNPSRDPVGSGYNITQSKIAIGSGGIYGRGLGKGSQSQLQFLPVAYTDFIFAGFAEATGFLGSVLLLLVISVVVYRSFDIARVSQDNFGMYLALGIAAQFLFQSFVNIGGNLGLVPITGIPLPFVSSGGTATVVYLAEIGVLESIYLRHKKMRFN